MKIKARKTQRGPLSRVWAAIAAFNIDQLFSRTREAGPPRTVYVNAPSLPADHYDKRGKVKKAHLYASNQVITSKYTVFTFLPRNLLEQFRRVANIFFLIIAILQFFPEFSTISPGAALLPLIVVVTVTALKDGYEDYNRHQSDRSVNYSQTRVLAGAGFANPNATQAKSKTFIRAILPNRRSKHVPERDMEDGDGTVHWETVNWEDIRVGDFVKIMNNESIPADVLICATSEEENVAFVETMNLDGETNLKSRRAVASLTHLRDARTCADAEQASFLINCDRPDNDMYRLNANVTYAGQTLPIDLTTTLLRGTVLRNTDWVIGAVIFTGLDSKIVMNSGGTPSKRSKVERQMNVQVLINLCVLGAMAAACAIVDSVLEHYYYPRGAPWLYGANTSGDNPSINGLITFAFALLTFQIIVPISLYISLEVVKTVQAAWIYFDGEIYYAKTGRATLARSWNLSDDLGQIEYIFSDKTGTLTQNLMIFRQCSIGGIAYAGDDEPEPVADVPTTDDKKSSEKEPSIHFKDSRLLQDIESALSRSDRRFDPSDPAHHLNAFFTVLGLCHTAIAARNKDTDAIEYRAQSPDEAALVQAAADVGFVFMGKDKETLSLKTPFSSEIQQYQLLDILEFTSARKRMSVVVRVLSEDGSGKGRYLLLSKGADNVIFERLGGGQDALKKETEHHLSEFANAGLRTLTLAYRPIPEEEYTSWIRRYQEATIALDDREKLVEVVSSELEQNLILLGATAIEDKLQDGVPETIRDLKKAGIKVWVATGDKMETAIAIGRTTNLIQFDSNIIILKGGGRPVHTQLTAALHEFFPDTKPDPEDETFMSVTDEQGSTAPMHPLRRFDTGIRSIVGEGNGDRPGGFVLVADGSALLDVFSSEENKALLLQLAIVCEGVICCRVSPLQKALVVKLVKDGLGSMTLAIGDGANDVSMIQAADVGVGVAGEEGLQAVNSSDYSIAQFRFLKKLLLVHGHWSYARNGVMILNFFYKNILPVGILWWFQIYNGWSANYVFDYIYILFWNSLWTVSAVVGVGLFDRFLDAHVLMQVPELYRYGRDGTWFGIRQFFVYMVDGVAQSLVIFFLITYTYTSPSARSDGYDVYLYEFSTVMALSSVLTANIFTGINATAWTGWLFFFVFAGTVVQWIFTVIYSLIRPGYAVTALYGIYEIIFEAAYFWFSLLFTFIVSLAPRLLYKSYKFGFNPGDLETFQYLQWKYPKQDLSHYSAPNPRDDIEETRSRLSSQGSLRSRRSSVAAQAAPVHTPTAPKTFTRPTPIKKPSMAASRTDLSTGQSVSVIDGRGFDFSMEEGGVAMRRTQTNLSERRETDHRMRGTLFGRRRGPLETGEGSTTLGSRISRKFTKKG